MIVKIQRPISPPDGLILVYDKKRKFTMSLESTLEVLEALDGDYKGYFEVERDKDSIRIIRRVADQPW